MLSLYRRTYACTVTGLSVSDLARCVANRCCVGSAESSQPMYKNAIRLLLRSPLHVLRPLRHIRGCFAVCLASVQDSVLALYNNGPLSKHTFPLL